LSGSSSSGEDNETGFLIEVDAEQVQTLAAHLKKFKLRARVQIRIVEEGEWGVWSAWWEHKGMRTAARPFLPTSPSSSPEDADADAEIGCVDGRAPGMGCRVILPGEIAKDGDVVRHRLRTTGARLSVGSYEVRRILRGVAEGQAEITWGKALPLESNMDYMGGIDFRKGCYVGQELTIRTHHTGVVRKRILPVQLYIGDDGSKDLISPPTRLRYEPLDSFGGRGEEVHGPGLPLPLPPRGATIARAEDEKARSAGKWLGGVGNIGLALCRLEVMTDDITPRQSVCKFVWDPEEWKVADRVKRMKRGLRILAFVPSWHHDWTSTVLYT
jgi:folate-binding protein YgfZ